MSTTATDFSTVTVSEMSEDSKKKIVTLECLYEFKDKLAQVLDSKYATTESTVQATTSDIDALFFSES